MTNDKIRNWYTYAGHDLRFIYLIIGVTTIGIGVGLLAAGVAP